MVLPYKDPSRPLCRDHYRKKCRRGKECLFYHPSKLTTNIRKEYKRDRGHCYCGSKTITLMNKSRIRVNLPTDSQEYNKPNFFIVCGRTRKSMKRCRSQMSLLNSSTDSNASSNSTNVDTEQEENNINLSESSDYISNDTTNESSSSKD